MGMHRTGPDAGRLMGRHWVGLLDGVRSGSRVVRQGHERRDWTGTCPAISPTMNLMNSIRAICCATLFTLGFVSVTRAADPAATPTSATRSVAGTNIIRIIAGSIEPVKDEAGQLWKPTEGFDGGQTMERSSLEIANTKIPSIYFSERFGMTKFGQKLPNGKYVVKLHFAITYDGITGPDQCVFSMDVEGVALKDFDVWKKAGGSNRAHVEAVPVSIVDGKLDIVFTPEGQSMTISAIEIIPAP